MKKLALSVAALAIAGGLMAQDPRFSLGAELALPMGTFGDASNLGFGGSLAYEMPMGDNLGVLGQAGFLSFSGKDQDLGFGITIKGYSQTMIPIQVGAKYYFTDNQEGAYLGALVGVHMTSFTIPGYTTSIGGFTYSTPDQSFSDTNFSFAPMVGYIVGENIDLAVRYQIVTATGGSSSYLGLRVAYMF